MCIGFEGTLVSVQGDGVVRSGVIRVEEREYLIGLACVPEARIGDRIIAHSGQAVRVTESATQSASSIT
jgi:hydrogenase maturation factor